MKNIHRDVRSKAQFCCLCNVRDSGERSEARSQLLITSPMHSSSLVVALLPSSARQAAATLLNVSTMDNAD